MPVSLFLVIFLVGVCVRVGFSPAVSVVYCPSLAGRRGKGGRKGPVHLVELSLAGGQAICLPML